VKRVLITGASTGIGEAAALRFAREGHRVFATVRKASDGDRLRARAQGELHPVRMDLRDVGSIEAAAREVGDALGAEGLDALVNNAGVYVLGPIELVDLEELRQILEVNVVGQVAVTQALLPHLKRARGRIVFVGSAAGRFAAPLYGPYAASKFALEAVADSLRVELAAFGVGVSVVEPGAIESPIWEKGWETMRAAIDRARSEDRAAYGALIDKALENQRTSRGAALTTDAVVDALVHALEAPSPKIRYLVGRDAKIAAFMARLPRRLADRVVGAHAGVGRPRD